MSQATAPAPLLVRLVGRIKAARQVGKENKTFRTLVVAPAADEFSHPSTLEVRSAGPIGQPGASVDVLCNVVGFSKPARKNPETGEIYPASAQTVLQLAA